MASRDVYGSPRIRRPAEEQLVSRRGLFRLPRSALSERIDYEGATAQGRRGWELEGHKGLLRQLEPAADNLVELAGVGPGASVLDVGAADGNVALAAFRRGAEVAACDLAPRMVARGRERCERAGAEVAWECADACALPYPDDGFDAALSSFGVSLASHPLLAARELARVVRPGGAVIVAAWSPRGLPGRLDELVEPYAPRPEGVPRASAWGTDAGARRRLGGTLAELELRTRTLTLSFPSADAAFDALLRPYALDPAQLASVRPDFDRALSSANNRPPAVEIDARYLIALGRVPS